MSERTAAEAEQLKSVADRLYALKPDDFAAARDAEVRAAREGKNQALAREIGKLRKPTQSAWLVNLLWRDQHAVMEQLFELAQELTQAQADAAGPVLRELMAQRRQLENALMRRAVELGAEAGVRVSDSVVREAQETLSAALALPEVADDVRSGHLVKSTSYAGFGATASGAPTVRGPAQAPIDLDAVRQKRAEAEIAAAAPPQEGVEDAAEEARRRAEEEEKQRQRQAAERRAAAERHLVQARRDAERAGARAEDAATAAAKAHDRVGDLRQRLDALRQQLQRLEAEVGKAEASATELDSERAAAEAESAEARKAVGEAEADLAQLAP
jgi:DNA repair exonuclease SbcCD ATPase subunit